MKKIFTILFLLTTIISISCSQTETKFKSISATEFQKLTSSDPQIIILDVRTAEEYSEGHIPNSNNIDVKKDDFANQLLTQFADKTKTYALYCRSGRRSKIAAQTLIDNGYNNVYEMEGGINSWKENQFPIEQ